MVDDWLEAACAWDKAKPLPHPGFRTGQVWGDHMGVASLIDSQSIGPLGEPCFGLSEDIGAGMSRGRGGHRIYHPDEVLHSRLAGCFLIADPACPWLAPWAPVEGTDAPTCEDTP